VHQLCHNLLVVNHDIGFLTMHPALSVLVTVTKDGNLVIEHGEFDVTVPLLFDGIQRPYLVFPRVPIKHLHISLDETSSVVGTHQ
jgi:hypothetical protein